MSSDADDPLPLALGALSMIAAVGVVLSVAVLAANALGVVEVPVPGGPFLPIVFGVTWLTAWAAASYFTVVGE